MVGKIISKGKKLIFSAQTSVLSAATIIMLMVVASRVLGLVRQRVLAHFFGAGELSLFFAAFRLPDLVFEVLVFGTFSSAFIPVFTKALRKGRKNAWNTATSVTNIGVLVFLFVGIILAAFANPLYSLFAPGYDLAQRAQVVKIARILFAAQGFFVVSYVLTSVLESLRRFLVPALAPLFYNLGIILGTILLVGKYGLLAPALGVLLGAFLHFLIQLPLAIKLGFRFFPKIVVTKDVRTIGKLALPRIIEVSFLQVSKLVELSLASIISTASYTYFTFASTLQFLPVGLFGASVAKAALPTLARQENDPSEFRKTLFGALYQIIFFVAPMAGVLIILRIPLVRLIFGTDIFSWESTVQTGLVVSAFALGVVFQSAVSILARGFYALHDTKTPVVVSISSILVIIVMDFVFIKGFSLPVWGLAFSFSIGAAIQATILLYLINKKTSGKSFLALLVSPFKILLASLGSGTTMFFLLKIFDRSVWVKRLSFLGQIEATRIIPFERFVLDTRYTANLIALTFLVTSVGVFIYLAISMLLGLKEVWGFFGLAKGILIRHKVLAIPKKETEPVSPPPTDTQT
ncbi:murein biosynthesis integral membrane protein MurJ [Candidatus Woesebacteria bacterium RBG_19FT_COMBO_42_9]|uniref:Probable lipid II flippase MurJ n=1 Tax=Candidatus Woesebacteria bacterium RBG_16_42_24 TaxID=1802485 RepID=A0A1F7XLH6_9BACT|nr:MAG: murein biosynthesis integral membrane protein MurJ [Candidatus Woesebacteria bacterium RBG_16_42_24]OGM17297.1 MAG: murein biosynthesis integral membrane protein MurJ [Candidatus Woesebacteria bacterium RBG_19FT_COMBO_42_9]